MFLIHGHDEAKRRELKEILETKLACRVVVMSEAPGKSRTLIEKLEEEAEPCNAGIAVLTPDDLVREKDAEYPQPRPNVLFELGWFVGRLGRARTLLVVKNGTKIPSDLHGIEQLQFRQDVAEAFLRLEKEVGEWCRGRPQPPEDLPSDERRHRPVGAIDND
ncbi:MAG: nucleotide-binding protein [Planctomycetota bacterium]